MKTLNQLYEDLLSAGSAKDAAATKEKEIKTEILSRFEADIKEGLLTKDEPFGVINLIEDGFKLSFTTPKKVKWDQAKLADLYDQIKRGNENPLDYMKVEYDVPEAKFKAWPEVIKSEFIDARTVEPGSISMKMEPIECEVAA